MAWAATRSAAADHQLTIMMIPSVTSSGPTVALASVNSPGSGVNQVTGHLLLLGLGTSPQEDNLQGGPLVAAILVMVVVVVAVAGAVPDMQDTAAAPLVAGQGMVLLGVPRLPLGMQAAANGTSMTVTTELGVMTLKMGLTSIMRSLATQSSEDL
jgi:hypothetical protein